MNVTNEIADLNVAEMDECLGICLAPLMPTRKSVKQFGLLHRWHSGSQADKAALLCSFVIKLIMRSNTSSP